VVQHDSSFWVKVYLVFLGSSDWYWGKKRKNAAVFGRESIRSGDPGHSGDQFVAGRASVTFSAKHRKVATLVSEETISDAPWLDFHVERTVAGTNSKPGQLVSAIGLAAQKAGRVTFSGIKEMESGIAGNGGVG
jgi:hypothetical protein